MVKKASIARPLEGAPPAPTQPVPVPAPATPSLPDNFTASTVPRYHLNLDLPPKDRWREIIEVYRDAILAADAILDEQLRAVAPTVGPIARSIVETAGSAATLLKRVMYADDLRAIADLLGLPLGRAISLQLIYEASAMCTSVVTPIDPTLPAPQQTTAHIRTMDWEMDFLKPLTVELVFTKTGCAPFVCATWVGYVGVLTGMRLDQANPSANFSVSVNFRAAGDGTIWTNLKRTVDGAWPIGYLVRETLERASGFDQAVEFLRRSELIAPVYFTVAGPRPSDSVLITRTRKHGTRLDADDPEPTPDRPFDERLWRGAEHDGTVIQCNADWWSTRSNDDVMESFERRRLVERGLERRLANVRNSAAQRREDSDPDSAAVAAPDVGPAAVPSDDERRKRYIETHEWAESLWEVMSRDPICNEITIYGTLMVPALGVFETRIPAVQAPPPRVAAGRLGTLGLRATDLRAVLPARLRRLDTSAFETCERCHQCYDPVLNAPGQCAHAKPWHAKYADCDKLSCAWGLGPGRIGCQHWGCCFSTDRNAMALCPKSSRHVPKPK